MAKKRNFEKDQDLIAFKKAINKLNSKKRYRQRIRSIKKILSILKKYLILAVVYSKQGIVKTISFFFQKEIILAATIFISSWINYQQSEKIYDQLTEQKIEIAKIETQLGMKNKNVDSFFKNINWPAVAAGLYIITTKIQYSWEKKLLNHKVAKASQQPSQQVQKQVTEENNLEVPLSKSNRKLEKEVNNKDLEIQNILKKKDDLQNDYNQHKSLMRKKKIRLFFTKGKLSNSNKQQNLINEKIERLTNELTNLYSNQSNSKQKIKKLESDLSKAYEDYKILEKNYERNIKQKNILSKSLLTLNQNEKNLNNQINALLNNLDNTKKSKVKLEKKLTNVQTELMNLKTKKNSVSSLKEQDYKNIIKKYNDELIKLEKRNFYITNLLTQYKNEKINAEQSIQNLQNKLKKNQEILERRDSAKNKVESYIKNLHSDIQMRNSEISFLKSKVNKINNKRLESQQILKSYELKNKQLQSHITQLISDFENNKRQVKFLVQQINQIKNKYENANKENQLLKNQLQSLEKKLDTADLNFNLQQALKNKRNKGTKMRNDKEEKRKIYKTDTIQTGTVGGMDGLIVPLVRSWDN